MLTGISLPHRICNYAEQFYYETWGKMSYGNMCMWSYAIREIWLNFLNKGCSPGLNTGPPIAQSSALSVSQELPNLVLARCQ